MLATAQAQPDDDLAFVNTQKPSDDLSVKYARDGKPRATAVTVKLNQVRGLSQDGKAYLVFRWHIRRHLPCEVRGRVRRV